MSEWTDVIQTVNLMVLSVAFLLHVTNNDRHGGDAR